MPQWNILDSYYMPNATQQMISVTDVSVTKIKPKREIWMKEMIILIFPYEM